MAGIHRSGPITQVVGVELYPTAEIGVVTRRQYQMKIPGELVRRHRLQIQMQGVAMGQAPGLGELLFGLHPADFDLRKRAGILRQHIEAQRPIARERQANADGLVGEEVATLTQRQHAIDELALVRTERTAIEAPTYIHCQSNLIVALLVQPFEADDRRQSFGILARQQGETRHQRNEPQAAQQQRPARRCPVAKHEQQRDGRQRQYPDAPEQAGTESQRHQPDSPQHDQQQAAEYQQRIHPSSLKHRPPLQGSSTLKWQRAVAMGSA